MEHDNWMVIESSAGVISLLVRKGKNLLFQRSGYERVGKELLMDLNELSRGNGGYPVSTWGDNEVNKKPVPVGSVVFDQSDVYPRNMGKSSRKIFGD